MTNLRLEVPGLGLASMRERVQAADGCLASSAPARAGTATAPRSELVKVQWVQYTSLSTITPSAPGLRRLLRGLFEGEARKRRPDEKPRSLALVRSTWCCSTNLPELGGLEGAEAAGHSLRRAFPVLVLSTQVTRST